MLKGTQAALMLDEAAGVAYLALAALILLQAKRSRTGIFLAFACACTAAWAFGSAFGSADPLNGIGGALDLVRAAVWYGFILHLYRRVVPRRQDAAGGIFVPAGIAIVAATLLLLLFGADIDAQTTSLASGGIALRLFSSLCQLLLLENLYRNSSDNLRWILKLTCIALGGLAAYDVLVCADAALLHRLSPALVDGRPLVACVVVPLLALAAARNQRWAVGIHVSRSAVFYSATLVASGIFLLALAAAGELAREFSPFAGPEWGGVTQIGLVFSGVIAIAVLLTSTTSRSRLRAMLVDHFFTHRYDYRREWLRCIETLSGQGRGTDRMAGPPPTLETRAVQALAQLVDSPAGVLLLRDQPEAALQWAGAWNVPSSALQLPPQHPLVQLLGPGGDAVALGAQRDFAISLSEDSRRQGDPAWLAVPLRQGEALAGCVLLAPPRAAFRLDSEVFELLRTAASEVATYLAEQRAARVLSETHQLRDYGQRFAFVAHDIKNVSSQLSLLLSNAEIHLSNPEFQRDMITTVQASVQKISALIRRLQTPEETRPGGTLVPGERLEKLAESFRRTRSTPLQIQQDGRSDAITMDPATFDIVVTHLLDNAVEAADPGSPVTIQVRQDAERLLIDIIDRGRGMTPEFIRDELFRPFRTSKPQGSGIGAFQARELLRASGGNLIVLSQPGQGTTMRLLLPLAGSHSAVVAA